MIMTGALGVVAPTAVLDKSKMTPKEKKTSASIAGAMLGGIGAYMITDATKGKSFVWNSKINKGLKNVAAKAGEFVKNSPIANYIAKISKNSKLGETVGKSLQSFANFGAEILKNVSTKVAKTSGRQKLLAGLAVGTLALIMAAREHYSKQEGAETQKASDKKIYSGALKAINTMNDKKLEAKDFEIEELKTQLEIKKAENEELYKTIEKADKAAEKLGVDKELADEMTKTEA